MLCSPRRRGWTDIIVGIRADQTVFPAQAGMDRSWPKPPSATRRVPRAGGDGPPAGPRRRSEIPCSPRRRGWTGHDREIRLFAVVFPAQAGMDRLIVGPGLVEVSVPRAGGDGPQRPQQRPLQPPCSPRRRGWTAEDRARAHARRRVPRAGGDGPPASQAAKPTTRCSPRRRGWTGSRVNPLEPALVFPAQAGMDRWPEALSKASAGVPRAGGDGPSGSHA